MCRVSSTGIQVEGIILGSRGSKIPGTLQGDIGVLWRAITFRVQSLPNYGYLVLGVAMLRIVMLSGSTLGSVYLCKPCDWAVVPAKGAFSEQGLGFRVI